MRLFQINYWSKYEQLVLSQKLQRKKAVDQRKEELVRKEKPFSGMIEREKERKQKEKRKQLLNEKQ